MRHPTTIALGLGLVWAVACRGAPGKPEKPTAHVSRPPASAGAKTAPDATGLPGPGVDSGGDPDGDGDGDGIVGIADKCPKEAEDRIAYCDHTRCTGESDGCPAPDADSDAVPDRQDRCPKVAETWNGIDDDDGCPEATPAVIDRATFDASEKMRRWSVKVEPGKSVVTESSDILIVEKMRFVGRTDSMTDDSMAILAATASTFRDHTEFTLVHLVVNVSGGPSAQADLELSRRRAMIWRAAMISFGVDANRVRAFGIGRHCPQELPSHPDGQSYARAFIVRTDNGPTGVDWICKSAIAAGLDKP